MVQHKQVQVTTEALDMINQGRSANYKPNIWKYEFVQALNNEYDEKIHERRAAKLKEDVKRISVEANGLLVKLEMIDDIMKLGLESLFGKEIKEGLYSMALLINHNNQVFAMTSMLPHYALGYLDKLSSLTRWWRNLGLTENLTFARDRSVECFLWSTGVASDYQFGSLRKTLTKAIYLILILDDVYDIYGSQFTNAIDRWDSKEIEQLPDRIKRCFDALSSTTNEAALDIQKEKGWKCVLPHLKKAVRILVPVLCIHAFIYIVDDLTGEVADFLENKQDLVYYLSIIIRLCNDLGTSKAEMERGDSPSSILCYMQEAHVPEETARRHIRGLISQMWQKLNTQFMTQSPLVQQIVKTSINIARVAYCIYQYGDGFGVQDQETRVHILSTLVEPLKLT